MMHRKTQVISASTFISSVSSTVKPDMQYLKQKKWLFGSLFAGAYDAASRVFKFLTATTTVYLARAVLDRGQ